MNPLQDILSGPVGDLGFGGIVGAVAGYAAKKASKIVALALGAVFLLIQGLAYFGLIDIHWGVVENLFNDLWVGVEGTSLTTRAWKVITSNLPFGGGFALGFAAGFKMG